MRLKIVDKDLFVSEDIYSVTKTDDGIYHLRDWKNKVVFEAWNSDAIADISCVIEKAYADGWEDGRLDRIALDQFNLTPEEVGSEYDPPFRDGQLRLSHENLKSLVGNVPCASHPKLDRIVRVYNRAYEIGYREGLCL